MLRITTIIIIALLVVSGFLLAVFNDRYKILDTFQHKFFDVTTDTGGEACFEELEERGIEYKHIGKMGKDIMSGEILIENATLMPLLSGFTAAFITGLFACKWMIQLVKKSKLKYFSFYCFFVGTVSIISIFI